MSYKKITKFTLMPLGEIRKVSHFNVVHIYKKYIKGLKYLDNFSHVIIFVKNQQKNERFIYYVVRILRLEAIKGLIFVDNIDGMDDTIVYDIKPYFSCEDRILEVIEPMDTIKIDRWRVEDSKTINSSNLNLVEFTKGFDELEFNKVKIIGEYNCIYGIQTFKINEEFNYKKLAGYSHARVIWWFNRFDKEMFRDTLLCNPPYESAPTTGVFATRSPVRPNPIASTVVKILNVCETTNSIEVQGFDGFEKSLIVDIIPYKSINERVRNVKVPSWLFHWPEWKSFKNPNAIDEDILLLKSDVQRVKQLVGIYDESALNKRVVDKQTFIHDKFKNYPDKICIYNASQNNLKNISINIPKNKISVVTGVSGSGKSSLVFDTIYAESQRQFMDIMGADRDSAFEKSEVEQITGLQPAIAIEQKSLGRNPRSTVGTVTGISEYLRLLFTSIGVRHCPECHRGIEVLCNDEIVNLLYKVENNSKIVIYPYYKKNESKTFVVKNDNKEYKRCIKECIISSLETGNGALHVIINDEEPLLLQTKQFCYPCNRVFFDITTSIFSYNHPEYMCSSCKGLGVEYKVDENLIISNRDISILDGASKFWGNLRKFSQNPNANWMRGEVLALAQDMYINLEVPYKDLPEKFKQQLMYGSDGRKVKLTYKTKTGRQGEIEREVEGVINSITRLFRNKTSDSASRIIDEFMSKTTCSACNGERLSEEGRLIEIDSVRYPIAVKMKITELKEWIYELNLKLPKEKLEIVHPIIMKIYEQLEKIINVGLSYLTIDRAIPTLSGGESQRLRLASQFGANLTNILYVLDEPSMGLHPKDYKFLIKKIQELKERGNTIVMVEHEKEMILEADFVVDIGPAAGKYGGEIIAMGSVEEIISNKNSITGKYLKRCDNCMVRSTKKFVKSNANYIQLLGAKTNNLKNIDVSLPLKSFICVTGVSGSGKSSLISKTLYPAIARKLGYTVENIGIYEGIKGVSNIENIVWVSQQPIGRTPRSNPATYTGVFEPIRNLYARTNQAKERNFKKEHFSFNSKKGQCSVCSGVGKIQTAMNFMPDIWTKCTNCNGVRYKSEILDIKYKGYSISDVLEMDIDRALSVFDDEIRIKEILQMIHDVGLGYIKLGQSALTLSGGEAQRIKLAKELSQTSTNNVIYILDEPTTGLHSADIEKLLEILFKLTNKGNTVIVIEHDMDFIKNADWIIDLGPSGGEKGGYIIAEGTPYDVSKNKNSATGQMLKNML